MAASERLFVIAPLLPALDATGLLVHHGCVISEARWLGTIVRLLLLLVLVSASSAEAAERISAKAWGKVGTYDMRALQQLEPLPMRQIVGVRFNYRHSTIRHLKPNWFQSSIWRYTRGEKDDFDYIQVMVAKADLEAFRALPTDFRAGSNFVVYGQILKDQEAGFTFLRLLGTKVQRGKRGVVTVSW